MRPGSWRYAAGEYAAGLATALLTAAGIHAVVETGADMVLGMLAGSALGLAAHAAVMLALGPAVGFFQVMVPGALIGMYGGMLFGMRDSMQHASWSRALAVAALFGALVVAGVRLYDRVLRSGELRGPEGPE